ncbi:uncharacterized protein [Miscanthus floridulus]|uniref:uncharacterized protein n=1 Tax=Miscanthus floridulus TaxID=154761 RepID=UPI0034583E19
MASSSIHIHHPRLASDEIHRTLESSYSPSASYCSDDAFVPIFRQDPPAPSASASAAVAAAADCVRSLFISVDVALFRDALFVPGCDDDGLEFTNANAEAAEYDGDLTSICWDCLEIEDADDPLVTSPTAEEFEWEEVASPSGAAAEEAPDPEWEVLADVLLPPADAEEGFVYTSHHREEAATYEVLVASGEGMFLKNKAPATKSAVEALPSAVVAAGQEGEGDERVVCKDGVAAGGMNSTCSSFFLSLAVGVVGVTPWGEGRRSSQARRGDETDASGPEASPEPGARDYGGGRGGAHGGQHMAAARELARLQLAASPARGHDSRRRVADAATSDIGEIGAERRAEDGGRPARGDTEGWRRGRLFASRVGSHPKCVLCWSSFDADKTR